MSIQWESGSLQEKVEVVKRFAMEAGGDMLHAPAGNLKHPFVVPGAVYAHHLWDWDCYFAVQALLQMVQLKDRDGTLKAGEKELYIRHAQGSVLNFLDAQLEDGYIPIMLFADSDADSRVLYRNGSPVNMHKPCLALNAVMISQAIDDYSWLHERYDQFRSYYECYKAVYQSESKLFVWADDVMIGVDNDPATFGRPHYSSANLFLNAFMVKELGALAELSRALGYEDQASYYSAEAEALGTLIQEECWDCREEIYYSVDVNCKTYRANPRVSGYHMGLGVTWKSVPIKIQSWASFIPMWAGIPNPSQAHALVTKHMFNPETFMSKYGVRSLARHEKMYSVAATGNPSNWLGPIWMVVQYILFDALMQYGYREEAARLTAQALHLLGDDIAKHGDLHEYYDPDNGEGIINKGFLNWNLLVLNMICRLEEDSG
ncbi:MGH1-like glycoside hydrolase domain-containing protein [Paenibacillus sp. 598K]|uniref:MGH1-like glycoside hydrolase domain-containing protein n=1 Tax=Paenibacillus sp. 598K TaxID=1117987 RepID=UPI000FFE3B56|nr:trehalase family glycosidase [Paenibacillus sp. 598K]